MRKGYWRVGVRFRVVWGIVDGGEVVRVVVIVENDGGVG